MNTTFTYSYKGSEIAFISGQRVMVNATQMAKSFDKRPTDWLKNQSSIEFLNELSKVRKSTLADLVQVTRGGNNSGTWMNEDAALEFARWLSPAFAIWCNDRIKELLRINVVTAPHDDEAILYAMQVKNKRCEEFRAAKVMLERQNTYLLNKIKAQAPKVKYVDDVLHSVNTYTSTQMAKELGLIEAKRLHSLLKEKGVMFRQSGQWMLTAKYCSKGYTKSRTTTYTRSDGSQITNTITVWTELGRAFLHKAFTKEMQSA